MNKQLIHRDLSWVSFNERVLQEAEDAKMPLYERLKFLAIFSSNLDEFYRVRISELRQFKNLQKDVRKKLNEKPKRVIKQIQGRVNELQERFGEVYREEILPQLKSENIYLIDSREFSPKQKAFSKSYFNQNVRSHIHVHELKYEISFDFLHDKELFLFLDTEMDVLINIPADQCPRFVIIPDEKNRFCVTYLDEIIRGNLSQIDHNYRNSMAYSVKITRDGEMYFDEYDGVVVELIKENLSQRDTGIPTRMLYDLHMPKYLLRRLRKRLGLNKTDLMPGGRYHNFSDFFGFPAPEGSNTLHFQELEPLPYPQLEGQSSVLEYVKKNDVLLNFPYQKYDYVPQLLKETAHASDVHKINITLYRVSKDSAIAHALMDCLDNGKKVTVFIEAKARFDEENNIYWGEKLKEKGAKVLYSMPKIKVHSKICLIEGNDFEIAYVGTGNFNEKSAKVYTDFALITANKKITTDLKEVFAFLDDPDMTPKIETLWMSPFITRNAIYEKIDREINLAQNGKNGLIIFKMNSLEDESVINKLYEASQAGVEVRLIVRGIFRLKPQVAELSENIKAVSVVGRFLEHGRIYYFANDGNEELYIASADCMTRNLDKRVEVAAPIYESKLRSMLKQCLNLQWKDNTKARILDANMKNEFQSNGLDAINSQTAYYHYLEEGLKVAQ